MEGPEPKKKSFFKASPEISAEALKDKLASRGKSKPNRLKLLRKEKIIKTIKTAKRKYNFRPVVLTIPAKNKLKIIKTTKPAKSQKVGVKKLFKRKNAGSPWKSIKINRAE